MAFTQPQPEWDAATGTSLADGPATTPGNVVICRAIHRIGSNGQTASITDNGGNTWHPVPTPDGTDPYVGVVAGGSGDLFMWYCIVETPFTEVDVQIAGVPGTNRIVFVAEWTGNATEDVLLDGASIAHPSMTGPLPPAQVTTNIDGALVTGALGATVSNRTFTLLSPGFSAGREHRAQLTTLISGTLVDASAGTHGPQWELGGSASTSGVITAAFRPEGSEPPPDPGEGSAVLALGWMVTAEGSAPEVPERSGAATLRVDWGLAAAGAAPTVPQHTGTTLISTDWSLSATGQAPVIPERQGTASVDSVWTLTADGAAPEVPQHDGTASADISWLLTATGQAPDPDSADGTASLSTAWTLTADGARPSLGSTSLDTAWTLTATGEAPEVDLASGTAALPVDWTLTARGAAPARGAATFPAAWSLTAQGGSTPRYGTASLTVSWTLTASGRSGGLRDIDLVVGPIRQHPFAIVGIDRHPMTVEDVKT